MDTRLVNLKILLEKLEEKPKLISGYQEYYQVDGILEAIEETIEEENER